MIEPEPDRLEKDVPKMMMSAKEFESWIGRARPGQRMTYHIGAVAPGRKYRQSLAEERMADMNLHLLARAVMDRVIAGDCLVAQRRTEDGRGFEYLAIRAGNISA